MDAKVALDIRERAIALLSSWGLELKDAVGQKGRGVFAGRAAGNSTIKPGENVLVSRPYAFVVSSKEAHHRCHHCLAAVPEPEKLMRCSRCKFVKYCSQDCQRQSWTLWHQQECPAIQSIAPARPTETILLMARLLWRRSKEKDTVQHMNFPSNLTIDPRYSDIEFLTSNHSKFPKEKMVQFGEMAMLVARLVGPSALPPSASDLVDLFCKFSCNNYNISDAEFRPIGVGLYPTSSLINHSCRPNCIAMFKGADSIIRAIEPIKQGDEISITYIEYTLPTRLRQVELAQNFFFTCDCDRCINANECEKVIDDEADLKDLRLKQLWATFLESQAQKQQMDLALLREASKLAESTLVSSQSHCFYQLSNELQQRFIDSQHWADASSASVAVLRFLEKVCQPLWPILGLQYFMVGKLYWFREQTDLAISSLDLAFHIMSLTHHGDPLLQELAQLRAEAMLELEMNRNMMGNNSNGNSRFSTKPPQKQIADK